MTQYFIIGADGREYGPATVEAIRQWARERRATPQTRVRREDEGSWSRMGDRPEFADSFAPLGGGGEPPSSDLPPRTPGPGEDLAEAVLLQEPTLNIGDTFARAWDLLMDNLGLLIGAAALVGLLIFGVGSVPVVGVATALAFSFLLLGGLNLIFLKCLRGEPVDIGVVFAGFNGSLFLPLLLAGVVASALSAVGLMLCVVPGVYLIVAWALFAPLLIIDKRLDFWQGLECSRRVVTRMWWPCFGLFVLSLLVVTAGLLACGVGVFFALPLALAAQVVAYEQIFGETAGAPTQEPGALPLLPSPEAEPPTLKPVTESPDTTSTRVEPSQPEPPLPDQVSSEVQDVANPAGPAPSAAETGPAASPPEPPARESVASEAGQPVGAPLAGGSTSTSEAGPPPSATAKRRAPRQPASRKTVRKRTSPGRKAPGEQKTGSEDKAAE